MRNLAFQVRYTTLMKLLQHIRERFLPLFLRKEKKLKILLKLLFFEVKDILTESTRKRKKLIQGNASTWEKSAIINPIIATLCPWSIKLRRLYVHTNSFPSPSLYHTFSLSWRLPHKQLKPSCPLCYKKYVCFQYFHYNSAPNRNITSYSASVITYLCLWILQPFIRDFSCVFHRRN